MSGCRVTICIAQVAPKENPPAAHCEGSGSTSSVRLIQAGTSCGEEGVGPGDPAVHAEGVARGGTVRVHHHHHRGHAVVRCRVPVHPAAQRPSGEPVRRRARLAGEEDQHRKGRPRRGPVGGRQIDVGLAAFEARAGAGDDGAPQHAAVGQLGRRLHPDRLTPAGAPAARFSPSSSGWIRATAVPRQVAQRVVEAKVAVDLDSGKQDDAEQRGRCHALSPGRAARRAGPGTGQPGLRPGRQSPTAA